MLGGLTLAHLLVYSLAVHFRRYMIQVTPFAIILATASLHWLAWRLYQRHFASQAGRESYLMLGVPAGGFLPRPILAEQAGGGRAAGLAARRVPALLLRGWATLVCLGLGLALVLALQGFNAQDRAKSRDAYGTGQQDGEGMGAFGKAPGMAAYIAGLARQNKQQVRVAADSWSLAYYSHGTGFPVPYTENRPMLAMRYLASNRINFLAGSNRIDFGSKVTGVPLYLMLEALSAFDQPWVIKHQEYPIYELRGYPTLTQQGKLESLSGPGLELEPGRLYLLHAACSGDGRRGKIIHDRALFGLRERQGGWRDLAGSLCPGPDVMPHNLPLPLGNLLLSRPAIKKDSVGWDHYLVFRAAEGGGSRLMGKPNGLAAPLRVFKEATLYRLEEPGQQYRSGS